MNHSPDDKNRDGSRNDGLNRLTQLALIALYICNNIFIKAIGKFIPVHAMKAYGEREDTSTHSSIAL